MKKSILIIIGISLFASCKKCYKCTTVISGADPDYYQNGVARQYDFCTTKDDDVYNEERRGTVALIGGGDQQTTCER